MRVKGIMHKASLCCRFVKLCKLGMTVAVTFGVVWGPFLTEPSQIVQVLHRVFPFTRGLYEVSKICDVLIAIY